MPALTQRFRLLAPLPLTVAFPSVTYRLDFEHVSEAGEWRLRAVDVASGSYWLCATGKSEINLEWNLRVRGVVLSSTVAAYSIFMRLVREGKAEPVEESILEDEEAPEGWTYSPGKN